MGFLAAHILLNAVFALSTRVAQARRFDFFFVAGTNYVVAFIGAVVWVVLQRAWVMDPPTVVFGAVQGVQYALSIVGIYLLLVRTGVGVTFILVRLSVIIPTLASIVVFHESPTALALAGVALMLASIPLVARRNARSGLGLRLFTQHCPLR